MASFPTSPHTFTQFANGALSDAAQVTDIYGEVEAIEAGLLNGTARLNSSNSTVANLSVTGGSTFASRPTMPPPDAARVYLESAKDLGSSNDSTMQYTAQAILTNSSIHSTGTDPQRLTPQSTGLYLFEAQLAAAGVPSVAADVRIDIRDSSLASIGIGYWQTSTTAPIINAHGIKRFDVLGGYGRVLITNVQAASTLSVSSGIGANWFSMVKL